MSKVGRVRVKVKVKVRVRFKVRVKVGGDRIDSFFETETPTKNLSSPLAPV